MPTQITSVSAWFESVLAGSPLWSAIGLAAAGLLALFFFLLALRGVRAIFRALSMTLASRKRRSTQGFGISIAPLHGPGGTTQTKAILSALDEHLGLFTFGSPYEVVRAPRLRIKGQKGLRASATKWLEKSSTDLVIWGHRPRGKQQPSHVEVLSLGGSLRPSDAMHSEGVLPLITKTNAETTGRVTAYLIARALQPGLSDGTAFRAEKLEPVAAILMACLQDRTQLPDRTCQTLESDYCSMALALGTDQHLKRVIDLRRRRLAGEERLPPEFEIQARIDLGRALLLMAKTNFDPIRVREAMDHLKVAVDKLKVEPVLRLAQATNQAVQQGQTMLSNRKRFSVTGGSTL
ncbi:MAG: hypothetical protein AAGL90_15335 [Pseudomonadota bacterium]